MVRKTYNLYNHAAFRVSVCVCARCRGCSVSTNRTPSVRRPLPVARLLQMVGDSLRGVEEDIGVISSEVDDEDMLLPCLDVTLKVRRNYCLPRRTVFSINSTMVR